MSTVRTNSNEITRILILFSEAVSFRNSLALLFKTKAGRSAGSMQRPTDKISDKVEAVTYSEPPGLVFVLSAC